MSGQARNVGVSWNRSESRHPPHRFLVTLKEGNRARNVYFPWGAKVAYATRTAALAAVNKYHDEGDWHAYVQADVEEGVPQAPGEDVSAYERTEPQEAVYEDVEWPIKAMTQVREVRGKLATLTVWAPTWEWVSLHAKDSPDVVEKWLEQEEQKSTMTAEKRAVVDRIRKMLEEAAAARAERESGT
eukprot:GHVU01089787.1.p1 GENE.GHVU01089787.1~~GHVU01089787.1.p1  ORF type:complete len:186 (-),score=27.04 GHVU01089787.1:444-1001(-)